VILWVGEGGMEMGVVRVELEGDAKEIKTEDEQ